MRKTLIFLVLFVMLMSCVFGKTLVMANAEESGPSGQRYYTSIEIKNGDTLWKIAGTYRKGSGMNTKEYIRELKQMNRLLSDDIQAGEFLTIVYYSDEPLEIKH